MAACALYCLVISILGCIFLGILGFALHIDYPYLKAEDRKERAWSCWYGALVYVATGLACMIWLCISQNRAKKVANEGAGEPTEIEMAGREKVANDSLEDGPNASLLKNA